MASAVAREILPCAACLTPDGPLGARCKRPRRSPGEPWGYDGEICGNCVAKFRRRVVLAKKARKRKLSQECGARWRAAKSERREAAKAKEREARAIEAEAKAKEREALATIVDRCIQALSNSPRLSSACDLCGIFARDLVDGSDFEIVGDDGKPGRVCIRCRDELRQERAAQRFTSDELPQYSTNFAGPGKSLPAQRLLIWGNPVFFAEDLTLRARVRLEVAAADKRARRKPKPTPPPPPSGPPCVTCGTTEGAPRRSGRGRVRLEGSKLGSPGLHCKSCYRRLYEAIHINCTGVSA